MPTLRNVDELGSLGLTPDEERAIVAFLKTLSDGHELQVQRICAPGGSTAGHPPRPCMARMTRNRDFFAGGR